MPGAMNRLLLVTLASTSLALFSVACKSGGGAATPAPAPAPEASPASAPASQPAADAHDHEHSHGDGTTHSHEHDDGHEHADEGASAGAEMVPMAFDAPPPVGTKAKCAVSGETFVVADDTDRAEHDGKHYVFCCSNCVGKFKEDPAKFAKK